MKKQIILLATILALASCKKVYNTPQLEAVTVSYINAHHFTTYNSEEKGNNLILYVRDENGKRLVVENVDPTKFWHYSAPGDMVDSKLILSWNWHE